jgi:vacuolar protein sorting-associated protein 13A/C
MEHKVVDLNINVDAPIFIFPQSHLDLNCIKTVFDLGHLKILSNPQNFQRDRNIDINKISKEKLLEMAYDRYDLDLSDLHVNFTY